MLTNSQGVIHLAPLHSVPVSCFGASTDFEAKVRALRNTAEHHEGFFLLRNEKIKSASHTFVLTGDMRYNGRWFLGKVQYDPHVPDVWEVSVMRKSSTYLSYALDRKSLADIFRFLAIDGDEDIFNSINEVHPNSKEVGDWDISLQPGPFVEYGFPFDVEQIHSPS